MRIRFMYIVIFALCSGAGIAGFFIPFSSFSLDVVEQNQSKNLAEQNRKLLKKIHGTHTMLRTFDTRLNALKARKQELEKIAGLTFANSEKTTPEVAVDARHLEKLLEYVSTTETMYAWFARHQGGETSIFEHVPVIAPVDGPHVVSAVYGEMRDPFTGEKKWHYGVDFAAKRETPVVAAAAGVVISVENLPRWGRRLRIQHAYGFSTVYAHLGTVNVVQGKRVKRGEQIATIGISGTTTGPHLHYELWLKGRPVNPADFIFPDINVAGSDTMDGRS